MQKSKNETSIIAEKTTTFNILNTVVELMQSDNIHDINAVINAKSDAND